MISRALTASALTLGVASALLPGAAFAQTQSPVAAPGTIGTLAGSGAHAALTAADDEPFALDGPLGGRTWGVAVDANDTVFIGLFDDGSIARLNGDGTATRVVSGLAFPMVFDLSPTGDLLLADQGNDQVLLATAASDFADVFLVAGSATVSSPGAARYGANGKIYVADTGNHRILELEPDLSASRVVAGGRQGLDGDGGAAVDAALNFPIDMDVDARGALVIADAVNNRLRAVNLSSAPLTIGGVEVDPDAIETLAGVGQPGAADASNWADASAFGGFSGDGGPAIDARIDWPFSPRFDGAGRIVFADADNHRLRLIDTDGTIHTLAGDALLPNENGFRFVGSDGLDVGDGGDATDGDLNRPMDLELLERQDGTLTLLVGDTDNDRVRLITGLRLGPQAPPAPGFARDVLPILQANCTGCHRPGGFGPFSLLPNAAHANLVDVASAQAPLDLVTPGDADASYLVHKLAGTHRDVGGGGSQMPRGRPALSQAEQELIREWIQAGALDD